MQHLEAAQSGEESVEELKKQIQQRTAELDVINSIQEGLSRNLSIDGIYELVGEKIREIFNAQVIDIVTYDKVKDLIEDKYSYEKGDRTLLGPREPGGFRKYVIESRESFVIKQNVKETAKTLGHLVLQGEWPKSAFFVPLIAANEVVGIITLQYLDKEEAFTDADVNLLKTIAGSMTMAIENARLFSETARLLSETERRSAELAVINSVQEGLARELELQAIYELVGEKIREIFNAEVIDIVTYDKASNLIEDRYSYERGDRTLLGPREPIGFRKHVIATQKPLLIVENMAAAMMDLGNIVVQGEASNSVLFVPMIASGEVTGVISLQSSAEKAFDENDQRLLTTLSNSMSGALENARLFNETNRLLSETERRTAELSVINSVQEGLAKELEIQSIYELVGEKIREIFNAQVIDIVTYDAELQVIEDRYSYEKGDRTLVGPREPKGFRKHVIETKETLVINNDAQQAREKLGNIVVHGEAPKSVLFVPLLTGQQVNGVISLQNLDRENAFSPSDVSLMKTLANSMTVALQNARLFDETNRLLAETEQRTAELSVINSVQDGLAKELDISGIYELVGETIRQIFNAQVIDIVTFERNLYKIEDRYSYENGDRTLIGLRSPKGFRKHVIETGETLVINTDLENQKVKYGQSVIVGEAAKAIVMVPLISGGKVNGVISLQNMDQENAFSKSDVSLLTTLSNSMSVALENARLFDETNRLLKETEQRTAELSVINSVQDGLAKEMDIDGIYNLVGEKMREIFNAQVIDVVTFNRETNQIEDRYSFEKGDRTLLGLREPKGFRKYVIESGNRVVFNENAEQTHKEYGNDILIGEMARSGVFVPMVAGNEVTGVISLQNVDEENAFSEADLRLLTTITNSMSVALESARLFNETTRLLGETEQRTAELSVINSVQEGLAKELDIAGIYELVGEKMREIFNAQVIDIATYDKEKNLIEDRYSYEKGDRTLLGPREPTGFRLHILKTGQLKLINENYNEISAKFNNPTLIGDQPKSMVLVPMIASNEVTGVISMQNLDEENAFSESDLRLLTTITNSMSVALESARLFNETTRLLNETEKKSSELSVINSVQEGLARELDIRGIYELVGDKMMELFNAQVVDIVGYDKVTNSIKDYYAFEKGDRTLLGSRPLSGFRKHVVESRRVILINNNAEEEKLKYGNAPLVGQAAKSMVFVPIITGDDVTGIISLQNLDAEFAFSESDVHLMSTFANSMSVALENARLFDETTRLLKETQQRASEMQTVNQISGALVAQLEFDALIHLVGEQMKNTFEADIVYVALYDRKQDVLNFPYVYGDNIESRKFGDGVTEKIISQKRPMLVNHQIDEVNDVLGENRSDRIYESFIGVPILVGKDAIGVISVQSTKADKNFSEDDQRLLTTIAANVGIAMNNAEAYQKLQAALTELKATQEQLVQSEKMASLGELTAGIAHEIQNPLNFVNNFSEVNTELIDEMVESISSGNMEEIVNIARDIKENQLKITHHGQRAGAIVKSMLQHSRSSAGTKEPTDINALADEYFRLAYHGLRAKDKSFNVSMKTNLDESLNKINITAQDVGRVVLNLITNAFYTVDEKKKNTKEKYEPEVEITTRRNNGMVEISVRDNGNGIPQKVYDKIFQPFFTTKPTGQGTGLGLSLSFDIIKAHGGDIKVETEHGVGSKFTILLPDESRKEV